MAKEFNVTGLCFPEDHYMADVSKQLDETYEMIEKGKYFIINRPRQYGKTTTMHTLRGRLIQSGYIVFHISFEGIGDAIFNDENYRISKWRTSSLGDGKRNIDTFNYVSQYRLPNKGLNMEKVLENFQTFMKQQYSDKDQKFLERDGRLIFLVFIKPIINSGGYDFKEPQVSEERRLDVVITYFQHLYVAELKVWYGQVAHEEGLLQLADYLDRLGLDTGYLLIFDPNKKKIWKKDWVTVKEKRIFWVRV